MNRVPFEYQRYLASREWALLKRQVRARAREVCERCHKAPMTEVHHLTYERIGHESLEDLLGVCKPCHAYLSGRSDVDPAAPAADLIDQCIKFREEGLLHGVPESYLPKMAARLRIPLADLIAERNGVGVKA